jgi:hypothetical protein
MVISNLTGNEPFESGSELQFRTAPITIHPISSPVQ